MNIQSCTDPVLRRRIKAGISAIIPVGSNEQHGSHLPVSVDSDIVSAVATRVGRGNRFAVTPTISMGMSFEHAPFFQISIRQSTLVRLLADVCDSLYSNGIHEIFVFNGHYSNRGALARLADMAVERPDGPIIHVMSYWRFTKSRFDHGGFVETSLMLAISDSVRMSMARKGLVTDGMKPDDIERLKKLSTTCFPEATGNGIWGDPRAATAEAGCRILSEIVRNLRGECIARLERTQPNEILI